MEQAVLTKRYDFSSKNNGFKKTKLLSPGEGSLPIFTKSFFVSESRNIIFLDQLFNEKINRIGIDTNDIKKSSHVVNEADVFTIRGSEKIISQTFIGGDSVFLSNTFDIRNVKGNLLTNFVQNKVEIFEPNVISPDIIKKQDQTGEVNIMNEEYIAKTKRFELTGIITGLVFATLSLLVSCTTNIDWSATVPASVLFLFLTLNMFLRKIKRRSKQQ
jgi:hypothetical protein